MNSTGMSTSIIVKCEHWPSSSSGSRCGLDPTDAEHDTKPPTGDPFNKHSCASLVSALLPPVDDSEVFHCKLCLAVYGNKRAHTATVLL
jgi:hypothetical protein